MVRGDFASARDLFAEVARKFPSAGITAKSRFAQAQCETILGNDVVAARIVGALLAERPHDLDLNELTSFQLEIGQRIADPVHSMNALALAAALAPNASLRSRAQMALASRQFARGHYEHAWESYEFALAETADPTVRNEALRLSALSDLAASRIAGHDAFRVERAQRRLQALLASSGETESASDVQECLWLTEGLLQEPDPAGRAVYYEAVRLREPEGTADAGLFRKGARRFRGSPAGETARYYQAECYFADGRHWKAFKTLQDFVEEYPASRRMRSVIEREFRIGRLLNEQGKYRKGEIIMDAVALNNPTGSLADDAYMALGRAKLRAERFGEARDLFDLIVREYSQSEWANAAVHLGGVADLGLCDDANDREMLLARARSSFERYLRDAPDGPFAEEARRLLADCRRKQAQDMIRIAEFYQRRKQPAAAAVYHREVRERFGEGATATEVRGLPNEKGSEDRQP